MPMNRAAPLRAVDACRSFVGAGTSGVMDRRRARCNLQSRKSQNRGGLEADFLAVGGNLMTFLSASRQLHADIQSLTAR